MMYVTVTTDYVILNFWVAFFNILHIPMPINYFRASVPLKDS